MKKKPNRSIQEDRTWKAFSKYIRLRDANNNGIGFCIACQKMIDWKQVHAGHYIPRSYHEVKYDEDNVHSECSRCNLYLSGNLIAYRRNLVDKIGEKRVKELDDIYMAKKPYKISMAELREMEAKYKQLAKKMAKIKGITL